MTQSSTRPQRTLLDRLLSMTGPTRAQQDAIDQANDVQAASAGSAVAAPSTVPQPSTSRYQTVE